MICYSCKGKDAACIWCGPIPRDTYGYNVRLARQYGALVRSELFDPPAYHVGTPLQVGTVAVNARGAAHYAFRALAAREEQAAA
jgi:hypothetical protein